MTEYEYTLKCWRFHEQSGRPYIIGYLNPKISNAYVMINLNEATWPKNNRVRIWSSHLSSWEEFLLWGFRSKYGIWSIIQGELWKSPYSEGWTSPRHYFEAKVKERQIAREFGGEVKE